MGKLFLRFALITLVVITVLAGCYHKGDASAPIPHVLVPAPVKATRLVVVLPGRADDLAAMRRSGMAEAVHSAWPDADVILTGLAMDYYMQGRAPQRLHEEIVLPARRYGYAEVWLAGASMGGMGTIMYDHAYPGEMDGLILLAPYLGEEPLLREIEGSGGITKWQAGPRAPLSRETLQRELWRHVQSWRDDPGRAGTVWLAYGDRDRLKRAMPLVAPVLPADQVLVREGGHDWKVWSSVTSEILLSAGQRNPAPARP